MNSSDMPSEKYSFARSPVELTIGSTAIDFSGMVSAGLVGNGVDVAAESRISLGRSICKTSKPAATTASATVIPTSLRPVLRLTNSLGSISDSSLIPSGVISNAHDKTSATGNPRASSKTTRRMAQFGTSKNGKTCVAI